MVEPQKESQNQFTRMVKVLNLTSVYSIDPIIAMLDSGCHAGDLITSECVASMRLTDKLQRCEKIIGVCLDGHYLRSIGSINLQYHIAGTYRINSSYFYVVEGESLPWQMILGVESCLKYFLLAPGAFGTSRHILLKESKQSKAHYNQQMAQHARDVAANAARVENDKATQQALASGSRQGRQNGADGNEPGDGGHEPLDGQADREGQ